MIYIFLTGAILIFIFFIPFHENAISASSPFKLVIIHQPNFGWVTLSHIEKRDTSLFAFGLTIFGILLSDQKLNHCEVHQREDADENMEFHQRLFSFIIYSSIKFLSISFTKRDSGFLT